MRLINADEIPYVMALIDWMAGGGTEKLVTYKFIIDMLPTIDPVKHGHWETVENRQGIEMLKSTATTEDRYVHTTIVTERYKCSKCYTVYDYKHKFCPNCGAKMDEENEE